MLYVKSIEGSNVGVYDTSDGTTDYISKKELYEVVKKIKILGVEPYNDRVRLVNTYASDFNGLVEDFISRLRGSGVEVTDDYSDRQYYGDNFTFYVRFLGGFDAWDDGSEDICDSCSCNKKLQKQVMKCRDNWSKRTGINVEISVGEKAWTRFQFS